MLLQKLTEFFYTWEIRIAIILSMTIQIILVIFGSRRKISNAIWLKNLVWFAYMSADAVAIYLLGVLTQPCKEVPMQSHQLNLLWVAFMILHLGRPDTITAYSLEDINLWMRHLLNLFIQVLVALYIVITSWNNHNPLTYLIIPIFVLGVARYCERICALRSASLERVAIPFFVWADEVKGIYFNEIYRFLCTLLRYFADEILLGREEVLDQANIILHKTSLEAFRLVEDVLGLTYDLLYTKALLIYSGWGISLRCVYLVSSVATLTSFVIIHIHKHKWFNYPLWDVLITYFLMIGGVMLEIYVVIWVVLSDWTLVYLKRCQNGRVRAKWLGLAEFLFPKINTRGGAFFVKKRWSREMKQHNILTAVSSFRNIGTIRTMVVFDKQNEYANEMKEVIFKVIHDRLKIYKDRVVDDGIDRFRYRIPARALGMNKFSEFLYKSIEEVVASYGCLESFSWSKNEIGFDENLVMWHVATTLCYYSDKRKGVLDNADRKVRLYCKASRYISDYLMYLVYFGQKMLPAGNYDSMYKLCFSAEIERRIKGSRSISDIYELFLQEARKPDHGEFGFAGDTPLIKGMKLAVKLDDIDITQLQRKWEMVSEVWAHLLLYAAGSQTRWEQHAQQLRQGGEFITHVAALMAFASLSLYRGYKFQ